MRRYPPPSAMTASFGPGPVTPAVKWLLISNIAVFLVTSFWPTVRGLGLRPVGRLGQLQVWQVATYMFLHGEHLAHPLQHARAVDVRRRARTGVGHALLAGYYSITGSAPGTSPCSSRSSRSDRAAAVRGRPSAPRAPFTVCCSPTAVLPAPADLHVASLPGSGGVVRGDHRCVNAVFAHERHERGRRSISTHLGGLAGRLPLSGLKTPTLPSDRGNPNTATSNGRSTACKRKFDVYSGGRADD